MERTNHISLCHPFSPSPSTLNGASSMRPWPSWRLSVPCPIEEHLIFVTVFLCSLNGQITAVTGAVTAFCASAMLTCPSCWATCHRTPLWAPGGRPQVSQHHAVAALHQTLHSAGLSAASPGGEGGTGDVFSAPWGVPVPPSPGGHSFPPTHPWEATTALAQGWIFSPCCRVPPSCANTYWFCDLPTEMLS